MKQFIMIFASLFLIANSSLIANATDETTPPAKHSPLSSIYSCGDITDAMQRLACYDTNVAILKKAEQKKEIVAVDVAMAQTIKREAFGFHLPSLSKLGLPKIGQDKKIDALVVKVSSIRKPGRKYIIKLENGQVWQEVGGRLNYVPKGNLTATIKPKSMGSYMLSISNGKTTVKGLRVKRVE